MTTRNYGTGNLRVIRRCALAFADQLDGGYAAEQEARVVLIALSHAIYHGTLNALVGHVQPWVEAECARVHEQQALRLQEQGMPEHEGEEGWP